MVAAKQARRKPEDGQKRIVIEHVTPEIDAGRFPAKRVVEETVIVEADIFGDGHDHVEARLLSRAPKTKSWIVTPMTALGNDRWRASFVVEAQGRYEYTIAASKPVMIGPDRGRVALLAAWPPPAFTRAARA
jgi:starch synthase (maltosyl-transferring)